MAWAFLIIGSILIVAGLRGKQDELFALLKDDFTGQGNFIYWVIAVIVLVAIGNVKSIERVADAFLGLVILVIVLAAYKDNQDLFTRFREQILRGTSNG